MSRIDYCAGFMFSQDKTKVALIRKTKPDWQRGKLNGIGGKIEFGEYPDQAMAREFEEETGYETFSGQWQHFATIGGEQFRVEFFVTTGDLSLLKTRTEEQVVVVYVRTINPIRQDTIENLPWLIGAALDHLEDGNPSFIRAEYSTRPEPDHATPHPK